MILVMKRMFAQLSEVDSMILQMKMMFQLLAPLAWLKPCDLTLLFAVYQNELVQKMAIPAIYRILMTKSQFVSKMA